jgi:hypothetical protein
VTNEQAERRTRLMSIDGFIMLIRKPNDDSLYGKTERSFSLEVEKNRTFFYWTRVGGSEPVDGYRWCEGDAKSTKRLHPDWDITILDARSPVLPVTIDWEHWVDAHEPSDATLCGVKDKYWARNLRFKPVPLEMRVQSQFELGGSDVI